MSAQLTRAPCATRLSDRAEQKCKSPRASSRRRKRSLEDYEQHSTTPRPSTFFLGKYSACGRLCLVPVTYGRSAGHGIRDGKQDTKMDGKYHAKRFGRFRSRRQRRDWHGQPHSAATHHPTA